MTLTVNVPFGATDVVLGERERETPVVGGGGGGGVTYED
jgi:hypothetical protein